MRLITAKLYRAFPELDRFSDEQCVRFIKATARGWRRWLHVSLVGVVGLGGIVGAMALAAYLIKDAAKGRELFEVAVFASAIAVGPLVAIIARDLLLRLRVRRVLRTRAGCSGCGYHLLGLSVSEKNTVVCPECGTVSDVDPSLGELVLDETGKAKYQPSVVPLPPPKVFTPGRVRVIKRTLQVAALVIFVGGPLLWGVYEVWLHQQTESARADRVPVEKLNEMTEAAQPAPLGSADNAWDAARDALRMIETTKARVDASSPNATDARGDKVYADYAHIFAPAKTDALDPAAAAAVQETRQREETLAREYLEAFEADGVFEQLQKMAASPIAFATVRANPREPLVFAAMDEMSRLRMIARMNAARMKLAQDAGDVDEAVRCYEEMLALSRMCRTQPRVIGELVGIAFEALADRHLRPILAAHPSEEVLKKVESAMDRQLTTLPRERVVQGEKLQALDLVAYCFSDKKYTRLGRYSENALGNGGAGPNGRLPLGTYAQNRAEMTRYFEAYESLAKKARWERPKTIPRTTVTLRVLDETTPNLIRLLQSMDHNEVDRLGLRTMVALERYYAANKEYPTSLEALVPAFLPGPPIDPFSGKPLCYVVLDRAMDPQARGYLLYSVGNDGVDDGGKSAGRGQEWEALGIKSNPGTDYVLNDLAR